MGGDVIMAKKIFNFEDVMLNKQLWELLNNIEPNNFRSGSIEPLTVRRSNNRPHTNKPIIIFNEETEQFEGYNPISKDWVIIG